jgi:hypothetical protein
MDEPRIHAASVFAAFAFVAAIVSGEVRAVAAETYTDSATAAWFQSLRSPYTQNCCDQADCKLAVADYHDGAWWALSNRTGTWVEIAPAQITETVSIFPKAVLCEGDPLGPTDADPSYTPRVYCFAPPPIGF